MKKDLTVYIQQLHTCISRIEEYTQGGKNEFMRDTKTQDAVIRNLEVIGQVVKDVGTMELAASEPGIPWRQIAGTRDILAHQYLGVDMGLIWDIVERDLPQLKTAVEVVAEKLGVSLGNIQPDE